MAATLLCSRQPGVASNSSRTRADPASYHASSIIKDDLSKLMATTYVNNEYRTSCQAWCDRLIKGVHRYNKKLKNKKNKRWLSTGRVNLTTLYINARQSTGGRLTLANVNFPFSTTQNPSDKASQLEANSHLSAPVCCETGWTAGVALSSHSP